MRKTNYLIVFFIFIITSISFAQIEIFAPDTSVDAGSFLQTSVRVSDLTDFNIRSYQFDMKYDSAVVKPTEVTSVNTISEKWEHLFYNLDDPGIIRIAAFGPDTLTSEGVLVNILFDVVGQPLDSTDLILENVLFSDESYPVIINNGKIKINSNIINVIVTTNVMDNINILVDDTLRIIPYEASWIKGSAHKIETLSPQDMGNGTKYIFSNWSDGGSMSHLVSSFDDTTFIAKFNTQYYLTITSEFGTPQGEAWYDSGVVANISVEDIIGVENDTRHKFVSWSGDGENSYTGSERETSVTMTNPVSEHANWTKEYFLHVNSDYGYPFGEGWYKEGDTSYFGVDSSDVYLSTVHYIFNSWLGQGEGSYSGSNSKDSVIVNNPVVETATWDVEFYVEIETNPPGLIDLPGSGWYAPGEEITTITAQDTIKKDTTTYQFKGWEVNGIAVSGNPITVCVDSVLVIQANYSTQVNIIIDTNISDTKVIVDHIEYNAPYETKWMSHEPHTISVSDYQPGLEGIRYAFDFWDDGGEQTHVISPNQDTKYVADLQTQYYLTALTNPNELFTIEDTGWYDAESAVALSEVPYIGLIDEQTYRFTFWKVDSEEIAGNPIIINMTGPRLAEANYEKAYNVIGYVSENGKILSDVQLILTGSEEDTVFSNQNGLYQFDALFTGNYEITPFKDGYRFEPKSRQYSSLDEDYSFQDFSAIDTLTAINIETDEKIPNQFTLLQNYPNPFNGVTNIQYFLPKKVAVQLVIYNLLGIVVKNYYFESKLPGYHIIQWNGISDYGKQVPSGVYFYKLKADNTNFIRKMILLE